VDPLDQLRHRRPRKPHVPKVPKVHVPKAPAAPRLRAAPHRQAKLAVPRVPRGRALRQPKLDPGVSLNPEPRPVDRGKPDLAENRPTLHDPESQSPLNDQFPSPDELVAGAIEEQLGRSSPSGQDSPAPSTREQFLETLQNF
jgi:hypothetical protein